MADPMDMSLDDIIKYKRRGRGRGRGAGRATGGGGAPYRRGGRGRGFRSAPYQRPFQEPDQWEHDLFDPGQQGGGGRGRSVGGGGGFSTGTKIVISNLDFNVSDSDIKELFRDFGQIKKTAVHYDRSGRSLGTAHVIYAQRSGAVQAVKKYNGVPLDGKPMQISIDQDRGQSGPRFATSGWGGDSGGPGRIRRGGGRGFGSGPGSFPRRGRARGRGRGGRGGGGGGDKPVVSAEDLDAQLDAYREQMDTS